MKISSETVHRALDQPLRGITLSEIRRKRIVRAATMPRRALRFARPRRSVLRRACTVAASFAMAIVCATGVLAAVPGLAEKLNMLSRETLAFFQPIERQAESSDIRMEVIAAMNDGDTAIVYVGLTDTSGQNRLDDTLSVRDMEMTGFDMVDCDNVYQKPDGSVVLRIKGQSDCGELAGKKVTLRIGSIQAHRETLNMADTGYTVANIMAANPQPALGGNLSGENFTMCGSVDGAFYQSLNAGRLKALKATGAYADEAAPWCSIENIGVVDGMLHILTRREQGTWYNHIDYALADASGNAYDTEAATVDIGKLLHGGKYGWEEYALEQEWVLPLPDDVKPAEVHLVQSIDTYRQSIEGSWNVTFQLQQATATIRTGCDLDMKPWHLTEVSLSPIGLSLSGRGEMLEDSIDPAIAVTLRDGSVIDSYSSASVSILCGTEGSPDEIFAKYFFDEPLDPADVVQITVADHTVWQAE